MASTKAKKNQDGEFVCVVCGSRTHDQNVAYCSDEHAEADGGKFKDPTVGENNTDGGVDAKVGAESDGGGRIVRTKDGRQLAGAD